MKSRVAWSDLTADPAWSRSLDYRLPELLYDFNNPVTLLLCQPQCIFISVSKNRANNFQYFSPTEMHS